jgi:hypothetical protein
MNCYFCKQPGNTWTPHSMSCYQCPVEVYHTVFGSELLIAMYVDEYTVGLLIQDKECFVLHRDSQTYLLQLNYLPDINPSNVVQFTHKLLNLKAFA